MSTGAAVLVCSSLVLRRVVLDAKWRKFIPWSLLTSFAVIGMFSFIPVPDEYRPDAFMLVVFLFIHAWFSSFIILMFQLAFSYFSERTLNFIETTGSSFLGMAAMVFLPVIYTLPSGSFDLLVGEVLLAVPLAFKLVEFLHDKFRGGSKP